MAPSSNLAFAHLLTTGRRFHTSYPARSIARSVARPPRMNRSTSTRAARGSSGRSAHQEIEARLRNANALQVRYDPNDPGECALSYGLNRSTLTMLIFAITWLLFVTGFTALFFLSQQPDTPLLDTMITSD